ncbi:MAG TPA: hypothetical protein VGS07_22090 [Thermoanaerobaculia bacterium]|nr:hypothetical protein [Thermoanaerobaculia bacterium]
MRAASREFWRTTAIICFCIATAAFGVQAWAEGDAPKGPPKNTTLDTLSSKVDALAEKVDQHLADSSKPTAFTFQWLSYAGVRLNTTVDPPQSYQVEIWPVSSGGPSDSLSQQPLVDQAAVAKARKTWTDKCGCRVACTKSPTNWLPDHHPLWIGRLQGNKDGLSTSLEPLCDDALAQVLKRNGWVTIFFTTDPTADQTTRPPVRQAQVLVIERNSLAVDLGSAFILQNDGSWKIKPELAISAASRWSLRFSSFADLRYAYTPAKSTAPTTPTTPTTAGGATPTPASTTNDNPFASSGGSFRANFYAAWLPFYTPSLGLIGGGGVSTVPNSTDGIKAPFRVFAGVRTEVFAFNTLRTADFFGNASGYFQAGLARDRQWAFDETVKGADGSTSIVHHDDQNRAWVEGQIKFSDTKDSAIVYSARVFGDFPMHGNGPSDLRVSVLASIQVQRLLGFTTPPKG